MKYVDLFAGCGGMSLGFERAGFELILAVEKSEMATETLSHNFVNPVENSEQWKKYVKEASLEEQYKNKIVTRELAEVLNSKILMKKLVNEKIDIVVGGPPCQGFSMAGRRNSKDLRNVLPWQFLDFVSAVNPKAVVIENVVGISRDFKDKEAPFNQLQDALRITGKGYVVQPVLVNAMHFGVPEHRPRLMILGLRMDIAKKKNIQNLNYLWQSNFSDQIDQIPELAPVPTILKKDLRTVGDAIADLANIPKEKWSQTGKSFLKDMKNAKLWKLKPISKNLILNNSVRNHQVNAKQRFEVYQYLRDNNIPSKILNIPAQNNIEVASKILEDILKNVHIPAKLSNNKIIAKNKSQLIDLIIRLKTKKHSQRPLVWSKPSPTVVTLPDDYVHPDQPRIFTVRELARFQSFPDAFEFRSKETTGSERRRIEVPQYSQVGNAVAPLLAYAVAKKFYAILSTNHAPVNRNRT
jgi:DNA (cytosine-5)-methyltransferase 1